SFHVNSFSFTSKSMTVTSNAGGTLVVVFKNKADETQTATLTVNVAPQEFARVSAIEGELAQWNSTITYGDGSTDDLSYHTRTTLMDSGAYGLDTAGVNAQPDTYSTRSLYDAQDEYLGWQTITGSSSCLYDHPVVQFSLPMHVGKTWTGSATRTC